ncbi:MAG: ATP-dependent transcriptional regulator [Rhodobacterales bacterium 34-62-10]|nr:MAG: ATP-dependent transcriptional regulator [Rhodobacterales bacterium 34-62-10]
MKSLFPFIALPFCLLLAACMPGGPADMPSRAVDAIDSDLPPMRVFSAPQPSVFAISNTDLARDVIDLSFRLESGRPLPVLTRFEGPISLRVTGTPPPTLRSDLNRLLFRLRNEAGIDISQTDAAQANITIEAVSRAEIRSHLPQAACFVVPNISRLSEFRLARRSPRTDWARLTTRERMAIFVPNDASPQEVRDCLHEELAQALGPLNDLYRLPQSVFNDDNVHAVLTGYDMMVLRATYAPDLRSGMTRAQVEARLPAVLARINPAGQSVPPRYDGDTPREWSAAMETALGVGAAPGARRNAAARTLSIAQTLGWQDHRLGFAHYVMGRLSLPVDPAEAVAHFQTADRIFAQRPEYRLHRAMVASQLTAYLVAQGRGPEAVDMVGVHLPVVIRHENAALVATLNMLRAEALELSGRGVEAQAVRLDSLGWARYGFGADWAIRAKLREISALNPLNRRNGRI